MSPILIIVIIAVVLGGGGYAVFAMRKRRDEVSQRLDLYTEGIVAKPSKKEKDGRPSALTDRFDKALDILGMEAKDRQLDGDLVNLFIESKVWEQTLHMRRTRA